MAGSLVPGSLVRLLAGSLVCLLARSLVQLQTGSNSLHWKSLALHTGN